MQMPPPFPQAAHLLIAAQVHALKLIRQSIRFGGVLRRHLRKLPHHGCAHCGRGGMPGLCSRLGVPARLRSLQARPRPCACTDASHDSAADAEIQCVTPGHISTQLAQVGRQTAPLLRSRCAANHHCVYAKLLCRRAQGKARAVSSSGYNAGSCSALWPPHSTAPRRPHHRNKQRRVQPSASRWGPRARCETRLTALVPAIRALPAHLAPGHGLQSRRRRVRLTQAGSRAVAALPLDDLTLVQCVAWLKLLRLAGRITPRRARRWRNHNLQRAALAPGWRLR